MNSEMILYNLEKQAHKENYEFHRLYRLLYSKDLYIKAIAKVYKNNGSGTKGVDNKTIDNINDNEIELLIEELKTEKYQPNPVKRVYIPKKNGKLRPLGIPTMKDRLVQEVCRVILDTIYEPTFSESSHGFREKYSCHTALKQVERTFRGVNWFIEGDIEGYFDNIDHKKLINILRQKIKDEKFIRLIWKMLRAGYIEDWKYNKTYSGTPQGGIISPLLANIYLNELDKYIKNLSKDFNKGTPKDKKRNPEYRKHENIVGKLKKEITKIENKEIRDSLIKEYKLNRKLMLEKPYYLNNNTNVKNIKYVRYADDFLIGVIGSKDDCKILKEKISSFLNNDLNLTLSNEKTLITHNSKEAKFLGYGITISNSLDHRRNSKNGVVRRELNKGVRLRIPSGTIEKIIVKNNYVKDIDAKQWEMLHKPFLSRLSDLEIIRTYNSEIRGIYNYYCLAENVDTKLWQLHYVMEYSCLKTFCNKYKTTIGKFKAKHNQNGKWGINYENRNGKQFEPFFSGFKRCREIKNSNLVNVKPNNYVYQCTTELELRLKAKKCELCGAENMKFNLHHINKMKNLKGKERWEILMIGRQRKTLVVCEDCHKKIHNNN